MGRKLTSETLCPGFDSCCDLNGKVGSYLPGVKDLLTESWSTYRDYFTPSGQLPVMI